MNLRRTQELFWRAISWPTGIDDFLAQADERTRREFAQTFAQTDAFGRNERMQVYAEAYFWRLYEVLADLFDVTAWLMTPRRFHNFITDYVLANPSHNPDIRRFGDRLPDFLAEHAEARRIAGIEDVARVEWAILTALDARNEDPLTPEALREVPVERWPTLRFGLTAATHVVACRRSFAELKRGFTEQEDPPELAGTAPDPPETILVWRQNNAVFHRACEAAEGRALQALADGETFERICDVAAGSLTTDASPQDVVGWLQHWLDSGLIHRVREPR